MTCPSVISSSQTYWRKKYIQAQVHLKLLEHGKYKMSTKNSVAKNNRAYLVMQREKELPTESRLYYLYVSR